MASPTAITRGARRGILGLPESLPFQFFDDQTVVGRASASRAEQIAVRVPHRVRTLPPAESTQGVRRGHDTTQKLSSSGIFFSALLEPSEGVSSAATSSLPM